MKKGANINDKTPEGRLMSEMLFDGNNTVEFQQKQSIQLAMRANGKWSEESKKFIDSDEFKAIMNHGAQAAQLPVSEEIKPEVKKIDEITEKIDKLLAEVGNALPADNKYALLKFIYTQPRDKITEGKL